MNQAAMYTTTVSIESRVSASALFQYARELLRIDPAIEAVEYATELYFGKDDQFPVRIAMEFGEEDGARRLFEDDDDEADEDYVNPHAPYAELVLNTNASFISPLGGTAKDLHALVLVNLAEWLDDHSIDWGYYSDADSAGRWIPGENPKQFGNPDKVDYSDFDAIETE